MLNWTNPSSSTASLLKGLDSSPFPPEKILVVQLFSTDMPAANFACCQLCLLIRWDADLIMCSISRAANSTWVQDGCKLMVKVVAVHNQLKFDRASPRLDLILLCTECLEKCIYNLKHNSLCLEANLSLVMVNDIVSLFFHSAHCHATRVDLDHYYRFTQLKAVHTTLGPQHNLMHPIIQFKTTHVTKINKVN